MTWYRFVHPNGAVLVHNDPTRGGEPVSDVEVCRADILSEVFVDRLFDHVEQMDKTWDDYVDWYNCQDGYQAETIK